MKRLAFLLALTATPALAESIDCRTDTFGNTHCERSGLVLQPPLNPSDYFGAADAEQARQEATRLRQRVAALVVAGRCEEARSLALRAGDMALAQQAVSLCRTPAE